VVCDFNTILHKFEKRGGSIVRDPMQEKMEDLLTYYDLMDINPFKGKYTWRNVGPWSCIKEESED
jgi:hypothetical protein